MLFFGLWKILGDEIGKGAYGRVYKGLDLENGDFVAIKQVSLENIAQEDLNIIMVFFSHFAVSLFVLYHHSYCLLTCLSLFSNQTPICLYFVMFVHSHKALVESYN